MTPLRLSGPALDGIRRHGEERYPEECCGFLVGPFPGAGGAPQVERVVPVDNAVDDGRRRRYAIDPALVATTERRLEARGQALLGFYHSHPDHPARPSAFDEEHAWPWYTYVVLEVREGRAAEAGAFRLDEERVFRPVAIELTGPAAGG